MTSLTLHMALQDIKSFYGDRKAKRSQVPLINHIIEGAIVLSEYQASDNAIAAWYLHPMVQDDDMLIKHLDILNTYPAEVVCFVMEYRNIANRSLSDIVELSNNTLRLKRPISISPLDEVNKMLIADKVQNRKDFEKHHLGSHTRSKQLDLYFKAWLRVLGVKEKEYQSLLKSVDNRFDSLYRYLL